jgi:branched-chain amino acid transport system substrate-binding protein
MSKRVVRLLAVAAAAATALSACSSGGGSSTDTGANNPPTSAPSQGSGGGGSGNGGSDKGPIVIGMVGSFSGQYSTLGGFDKKTIKLMSDQLNQAGGIDGRKVKVVYEDDQTSPTQAVVALNKVVDAHPTAIIGPVLSTACSAIVDKVNDDKIPMVTLCASDSQVQPVRPYDFMATLSTPAMTGAIGKYLKGKGDAKVAVLYDSGDFGQSGLQFLEKQGNVDIVAKASYKLDATTFVPQLQSLVGKKPDAVIAWGAGAPLTTIAKEYKQLGSDAPLVFSGAAATPLFIGPAGKAGDGTIMASSMANVYQSAPENNPSKDVVAKLAKDYKAKYNESMSQFTADACGAWKVIVNGIKKAGDTDPTKVRDAIESNPAVGCHGTYKYSATDHRGIAASDVWVVTDKDGKLVPTQFSIDAAKKND